MENILVSNNLFIFNIVTINPELLKTNCIGIPKYKSIAQSKDKKFIDYWEFYPKCMTSKLNCNPKLNEGNPVKNNKNKDLPINSKNENNSKATLENTKDKEEQKQVICSLTKM